MNIHIVFLIFLILVSLQAFGAFWQVRNFRQTMKEIKKENNNLAVGGREHIFNSEYVILTCNTDGTILDARVLNGMTIFNRFKTNNEIIGKNVKELLAHYNELTQQKSRRYQAYIQALTLLKNKLEN
ncbi:transcriptional regulator GutM [Conservatibacter flavescens]|uniref:Uncharacterized protein n=1 Tax=Conservatibacter flavescens TaxID=28161 RepID=A0A2M8S1V5_9PAST|nr:transcriptional regulator GutM [Conservatibacter flavescens]PJG85141.1 hypothetical protein CVP05_07760 [Conservatibacter flavescens]